MDRSLERPLLIGSGSTNRSAVRVVPEWMWTIPGAAIGGHGLVVADVDGDGRQEVVATGSPGQFNANSFWTVSRLEGTEFVPVWGSLQYEEPVSGLAVARVDGAPGLQIVVSSGGQLYVYDGVSFGLEAQFPTAIQSAYRLVVADLDEDGTPDAALCGPSGTWAYNLVSGEEELALPDVACTDVAVGETDGTSGPEIVIANGSSPGLVLDSRTGASEWTNEAGFGTKLAVGDFDGDGVDEIAAADSTVIQVWNGADHTLLWGREVDDCGVDAIAAVGVDGNAPDELVFGSGQWGDICVLDGMTGDEEWCSVNPEHGVSRIAAGDVDDDGVPELVWGSGHSSTGKDKLYALDGDTHQLEGESVDVWGPFISLRSGDIDADGNPDLFFSSNTADAASRNGVYYVYDARTKRMVFHGPYPTGNTSSEAGRIQVGNTDGDPPLEIVRTEGDFAGNVYLQCIDGVTQEVEWERSLNQGHPARSLQLGDPDRDGHVEIAIGVGRAVQLFDGESGLFEWQSPDLSAFYSSSEGVDMMRIADVDADGFGEVIVAKRGAGLLVLDPVGETVDLGVHDLEVTALEVADLDGNQVPDIVIGTTGGAIERIDPFSGASTVLAGPFGAAIDGLGIMDLSCDDVDDYVFVLDQQLHIVDGVTGLALWVSQPLGYRAGQSDTLVVDDVDGDGVPEIWVNVGLTGHAMYAVPSAVREVFSDGFESGGTSRWTRVVRPSSTGGVKQ